MSHATATAPLAGLDDAADRLCGGEGLDLAVQIAHDLRSPLTAILALSEALQRGASGPVTDVQREHLRLIYTAAMHLCATSTDILEMARGAPRGAARPDRAFSVGALFESVRGMAQPMYSGRAVALRFIAPAVDRRLGREAVLSRVLMNLVTNALKVTERGSVTVAARETAHDRSRVVWSVSDTGPGLTVEGQRALYRVFGEPNDAGVARFSSAGLGLAICRKLVASMGATLHVDTTPGRGTRFHFEIETPRADA